MRLKGMYGRVTRAWTEERWVEVVSGGERQGEGNWDLMEVGVTGKKL